MSSAPDADTAALPQPPQLPRLPLFAVAAPGLETLVAEELAALGITATAERGGAAWDGTLAELYTANLWLRTASRVLARVGEFRARTFPELVRHAERLPWTDFITPGRAVQLRVSCHKSRLYHEKAVAERVQAAIERVVGPLGAQMAKGAGKGMAAVYVPPPGSPRRAASAEAGEPEDDGADAQLVVVRFHYDRCTISVDSSGALLHRRGYRQELARAPLRETLAAALLLASGWRGDTPLVDPFCGSGTIPIEAALIARGIAPGLASGTGGSMETGVDMEAGGGAATGTRSGAETVPGSDLAPGSETASRSVITTGSETRREDALHSRQPRHYAFQEWPGYDARLWSELVAQARAAVRPAAGIPILGADRDTGAIAAATANAERAGVLADLQLAVQPLSALEPPAGTGSLVTNPPYGLRVGEQAPLRDLYATLGKIARERLRGWHLTLLSADRSLERQVGIPLEPVLETRNGGIPVRVVRGEVSRGA